MKSQEKVLIIEWQQESGQKKNTNITVKTGIRLVCESDHDQKIIFNQELCSLNSVIPNFPHYILYELEEHTLYN